jgi:phage-related protein
MKELIFIGNSLDNLKQFPANAKRDAGFELSQIQLGLEPSDWKNMPGIGKGVKEIRINKQGAFRVIYIIQKNETLYVLHAFQKKTRKTARQDIELARLRLTLTNR